MKCNTCQIDVPENRMRFTRGKPTGLCKDCYNAQRRARRAEAAAMKPPQFDADGNRKCPHCNDYHSVECFQIVNNRPKGWCRKCRTGKEEERRRKAGASPAKRSVLEDGRKLCNHCGEMLPLTDFSPSVRGLGSVSAYCRICTSLRYNDPEKSRAATASYRKRHRERHLANHRVRMFEYRTSRKVTSDGSVTDALLKEIYGTESCYLCGEFTPPNKRTVEHKIPLSRGGTHTAENIEMACLPCNCSKAARTPEEHLERKLK